MKTPFMLTLAGCLLAGWIAAGLAAGAEKPSAAERPNILWLVSEDNDTLLGCYGDPLARTPTLDKLAREGVLYERCFAQPVCAPSRFTLITGMYAASHGPAQHMRAQGKIPSWLKGFPALLRESGYYTSNNAKTDYNSPISVKGAWDDSGRNAHWRKRPNPAPPFFSVFNHEVTHESCLFPTPDRPLTFTPTDPAKVRIPPYQPDTPEMRADWARYYDCLTLMDGQIAAKLKDLADAGLAENTIVFYYSDNGGVLPRSKRFLQESGTHVPLIVYFPPKWRHLAPAPPGSRLKEPVSFVDFAPTVLSLAGVKIPAYMQGRAFLGPAKAAPNEFVFLTRDRMDERYDMMRSVADGHWLYIHNYRPDVPYVQPLDYMFQARGYQSWARMACEGKLTPATAQFWGEKPTEELYDMLADPDSVKNLAGAAAHRATLKRMRAALKQRVLEVKDNGFLPEGSALEGYDASHQPGAYPVERVFTLANLASERNPASLPKLTEALADPCEPIRWWAAQGCTMLREKAASAEGALRQRLDDHSGAVQVAAAEALARLGQTDAALPVLERWLKNADSPWFGLQAANVLDRLGESARPALPVMRATFQRVASEEGATNPLQFQRRILERILAVLDGKTPALIYPTALVLAPLAGTHLRAADDLLIADFEGPDYGQWKTTGEAFGPAPARGTLPGQMRVDGFKGQGLVNSFLEGDGATGTLTSPEFKIERKFIHFLIGGGKNTETTCMKLLVAGKAVRNATGPNDQPGGSEALAPGSWDVAELAGRTAVIQIVDQAKGGWGHINVDHIVQTDRKPAAPIANAKREFKIEQRYLSLPIKNGASKRKVTTIIEGRVAVKNDIELADAEPDWWAFMDVSAWRGQTVTLQVDTLPEDSTALSSIEQSDSIKGAENLYREPLRGQFHFSSRRGWNNDPNGLVYFNGEYRLFYQHNPYGWGWGNMHWGYAVSRDLVHWQEIGDQLAPDEFGPMFSGSAVVDWKNTSGLGKNGQAPLVLIYTAAGNPTVQCIASSPDGRTFTKFAGNPVLKQITGGNRDPKVMWHEPTKKWVMVLYVDLPEKKHTIHFFTSPNLRDWTLASITEGGTGGDNFLYECPDFFELPVDGDAANKRWVLTAGNSEYAIGSFDGTTFTPEQTKLPGHRGRGFYAAQTFSDIPASDGRRIQIGWFQTATPGMPFNQSMTIPLELKLTATAEGPRLTMKPVKELAALRAKSQHFDAVTISPESANPLAGVKAELVELRAEFEPGDASEVVFLVRGATIVYDAKKQELAVNNHRATAPLRTGKQRLTIFCDRTGLEIFASDGLTYVPMPYQPPANDLTLGVQAKGGRAKITALDVHELRSAWEPR